DPGPSSQAAVHCVLLQEIRAGPTKLGAGRPGQGPGRPAAGSGQAVVVVATRSVVVPVAVTMPVAVTVPVLTVAAAAPPQPEEDRTTRGGHPTRGGDHPARTEVGRG